MDAMSFKRFFQFSLASLAVLSIIFTVLMLNVIGETSLRVANGRLASDAVAQLQIAKEYVAAIEVGLLTGTISPEDVDSLSNRVAQSLQTVEATHKALVSGAAESLYIAALERDQTLKKAWTATSAILETLQSPPSTSVFDHLRSFKAILDAALEAEHAVLLQKRNEADAALTARTSLVYAAVALLLVICVIISVQLRSRLDPAIAALEQGLAALKDGKLNTRVVLARKDEFRRLAEVFNFTAQKLAEVKDQDEQVKRLLEERVVARTADLSRAMQRMQDLSNERSKLLSDLGHELRTPLTIIRGEADVALRTTERTATPHYETFETIRSAAQQMSLLLDDLLDVSKKSDPAFSINKEKVTPDTCAQAALTLINKGRANFTVQLDANAARTYVDPLRVQQAILVLLENAIAYSKPRSEIRMQSTVEEGKWTLKITDFGVGIASEDMDRIFERGYRGDAARQLRPEGLGYGLSIAKTLVERQGGELTVCSEGQSTGSTFTIRFPVTN